MQREEKIEKIIAPIIDGLGYELVRISLSGDINPTMQIMIDNKDQKPIVVKDCIAVSKAISEPLDNAIDYDYSLEVSSPGVDRPLTKPEHFARFIGFEAKVETASDVDGRKRFKGKIIAVKGHDITIEMESVNYVIAFNNVIKAKLVLNDELLKAFEKDSEDNKENEEN